MRYDQRFEITQLRMLSWPHEAQQPDWVGVAASDIDTGADELAPTAALRHNGILYLFKAWSMFLLKLDPPHFHI